MAITLIDRANTGFKLEFKPLHNEQEAQSFGQPMVALRCRNTTGGTLGSYTSVTGYPAVEVDWANYNDGDFPPIRLAQASVLAGDLRKPLGILEEGTETVPSNGLCWVQVQGKHRYAQLIGDVAANGDADIAQGNVVVASMANDGRLSTTGTPDADGAAVLGRYLGSAAVAGTLVVGSVFIGQPAPRGRL